MVSTSSKSVLTVVSGLLLLSLLFFLSFSVLSSPEKLCFCSVVGHALSVYCIRERHSLTHHARSGTRMTEKKAQDLVEACVESLTE